MMTSEKAFYCSKSSGWTQLAVLLAFPSSSHSAWKANELPGTGVASCTTKPQARSSKAGSL